MQPDGIYNGRTRHLDHIGDSSEPKSNDEMRNSYGILIAGAVKGEGSVNYGIQLMQQQEIYVTARSTNIIKEYRNYWSGAALPRAPQHSLGLEHMRHDELQR